MIPKMENYSYCCKIPIKVLHNISYKYSSLQLKCYILTYTHTDRHTYRPSDEAGPRGAFAPKNIAITIYR